MLANLSHLPDALIKSIENILKSKSEAIVKEKDILVESCYDFGYIFVIEQLMKRLCIDETLGKTLPAAEGILKDDQVLTKEQREAFNKITDISEAHAYYTYWSAKNYTDEFRNVIEGM